MLFSMLLAAQGLAYAVERDAFTDAVTHVAMTGTEAGPMLAIECGDRTNDRMLVRIKIGRPMYQPVIAMVGRYRERVRFGSGPALEFRFAYDGRAAYLIGKDAETFAALAGQAQQVVLEMTDYANDKFRVTIPLSDSAAAIAQVQENCPR